MEVALGEGVFGGDEESTSSPKGQGDWDILRDGKNTGMDWMKWMTPAMRQTICPISAFTRIYRPFIASQTLLTMKFQASMSVPYANHDVW